jgi:hypothetical protein
MDNGLIFPYPREHAHDEAVDANHPKLAGTTFGSSCEWSVGSYSVLVKRWGDAGR